MSNLSAMIRIHFLPISQSRYYLPPFLPLLCGETTIQQRGQCILFSVVITPPPPPDTTAVFGSYLVSTNTEPVFVDPSRSPEIDSHPGGPVRQPYFSYRPVRLHRLAKSIPRNGLLVSINFYKYGLCIAGASLPILMIREVSWEPKRRRAWAS